MKKPNDIETLAKLIKQVAEKVESGDIKIEELFELPLNKNHQNNEIKKINEKAFKLFDELYEQSGNSDKNFMNTFLETMTDSLKQVASEKKDDLIRLSDASNLVGDEVDGYLVVPFELEISPKGARLLGKMKKKDVQFIRSALKASEWFESLKNDSMDDEKHSFTFCIVIDHSGFFKDFYIKLQSVKLDNSDSFFITAKEISKNFDDSSTIKEITELRKTNKHLKKKLLVLQEELFIKLK